MENLLLEIGTEELPSRFIKDALIQLQKLLEKELKNNQIDFSFTSIYGTPRRLAIFVSKVSLFQNPKIIEIQGPKANIAFDENNNPTKAAYGFAKTQNINIKDLVIKETPKGKYVFAVKKEKGKSTIELLSNILPQVITAITFPKTMRWNTDNINFIRPIRWLLALFGNNIIPFKLGELETSNIIYGHRFLSKQEIKLKNAEEYLEKLEENFVICDHEKRKKMIEEQIKAKALEKGGIVEEDKELLETVTFLTEYPQSICCLFDIHYLSLPREVLSETMKKHQFFFPIVNKSGNFLPFFISVLNTQPSAIIKEANEKVLDSRFADAKFYFDEDQKIPLCERVQELKNVSFLENMGTLYEKTERIKKISKYLAKQIDSNIESICYRIAHLCKADLVTTMVREKEYTNLHGIIGKKYAEISGEDNEISTGIFEYCLPRYACDILPQNISSAIVSIGDKIDTIVGCFAAGLIPTGSQDPHGNRRQGLGIIEIIIEKNLNIDFEQLIQYTIECYEEKITINKQNLLSDVKEFLLQRLRSFLLEKNIKYDIINAVLEVEKNFPLVIINKIKILTSVLEQDNSIVISSSRVKNILMSQKSPKIFSEEFLKEPAEKNLYHKYNEIKDKIEQLVKEYKYKEAIDLLCKLKKPIDNFFDNIMVMVENEFLKENRLSLLSMINNLYVQIADFSKIILNKEI